VPGCAEQSTHRLLVGRTVSDLMSITRTMMRDSFPLTLLPAQFRCTYGRQATPPILLEAFMWVYSAPQPSSRRVPWNRPRPLSPSFMPNRLSQAAIHFWFVLGRYLFGVSAEEPAILERISDFLTKRNRPKLLLPTFPFHCKLLSCHLTQNSLSGRYISLNDLETNQHPFRFILHKI
jgi:hypothetical protein